MANFPDIDLTDEETKAIRSLERLAKKWLESLGLFSWSGTLCVVKLNDDGKWPEHISSGVAATIVEIANDGGDPD